MSYREVGSLDQIHIISKSKRKAVKKYGNRTPETDFS